MASTVRLHGIPNCDTVKRARTWLTEQGVAHDFHDFKKQGVPDALDTWVSALGWEPLVNRQGTTWRKLPDDVKASVVDAASAKRLMRENPSVIKRPVVDWTDGTTTVGFEPARWAALAR